MSRVDHLVASFAVSGAARIAAAMVIRARKRGELTNLWAFDEPALHLAFRTQGLEDIRGPLGAKADRRGALQLARAVMASHADLLHLHVSWPAHLPWALMARGKMPAVITLYCLSSTPDPLASPVEPASRVHVPSRWLTRLSARLAPTVLVTPTEVDRRRLEHVVPGLRVICAPHAPPPPSGEHPGWLPWSGEGPKILAAGRLAPESGFDRLVRVFASPRIRQSRAHLCIAGDGPDRDALVQFVADEQLDDRVTFVGPLSVGYVARQADLFVAPARSAGFPIALVEAAHAGLPVLASPIAAHREVLVGCEEALLSSDESLWSEQLGSALDAPVALEGVAMRAHERALRRYGDEQQDAAYEAAYADLLKG